MRRVAEVCASAHVGETAQTLVAVAVALALIVVLGAQERVAADVMAGAKTIAHMIAIPGAKILVLGSVKTRAHVFVGMIAQAAAPAHAAANAATSAGKGAAPTAALIVRADAMRPARIIAAMIV